MNDLAQQKELLQTIAEINWTEGLLRYEKDPTEIVKHQKDVAILIAKKDALEHQIITQKINSDSLKTHHGIIMQFQQIIKELEGARPWLKILRDQGTISEHQVLGNILWTISQHLRHEHIGTFGYVVQYFTTDQDIPSIEIPEMVDFVRDEVRILGNLTTINYVVLNQYYVDLRDRIISRFVE